MGEEVKQEQIKEESKPEEKKEEKAEEKKEVKAEEKKEEKAEEKKEEPKPPSPFVLFVDLHCVGCAKKIERTLLRIRGVEGVAIDMAQNQVTIKGVVEPQAVCNRLIKKTKRTAKVLSPLPETEGEPLPEVVASQVSGLASLELNVNMHCEACAEQLKKKILKMKGVRTVETELSSGKVIVTGTVDADKLVDYVYRCTRKQAKIVPQPEPEKPAAEESKPENKKEEKPAEEAKPEEKPPEEGTKEGKEEQGGENKEEAKKGEEIVSDEMSMQKMMHYYQPLYYIERIPPPQLFSDENPNACCIA
ncbi:heavy metal-associated isoprenylated plant protein 9-like [Olea europaea var. sylvestris]|uniref:Heavy metal-associated isoprenylated plant 9 n=1 Tax=Olea europaea subsp. europaea TaxID=158383 RepID=A0A8S0T770_OLEEU|nr:heavy metal-associated isoprenylated plant protein 9-like [Olea europaea var. sylvestris]CAA2999660.1 heavy metal-associated isoprenylated plant 9 [Olea europaea subsp. europaea]